jgi:hypothetical protein
VSHCGAPLLIWFDGKHNKEHFAMRPYGLSTCSIDRRSVTPRRPQRDGQREPARRPSRPTRGRWPSVATRAAAVCLRPGFPFFLPRKPTGPTMRGMKLGQWVSTGRALPERAFSRGKRPWNKNYFLLSYSRLWYSAQCGHQSGRITECAAFRKPRRDSARAAVA